MRKSSPAIVGSSGPLAAVARRVVAHHRAAPAAVVAASVFRNGQWVTAIGAAGDARPNTLFDLASLTKPVTALTAARLVRQGALTWSTPLGALLPAVRDTPSEHVPFELFLAHRAGLAAHLPLFVRYAGNDQLDRQSMLREAASRRPDCNGGPLPAAGFPPVYSDMGYLLAGEALTRLTGLPLDELFEREVLAPLAIPEDMGSVRRLSAYLGAERFLERVAPTEHAEWRGGVVRGKVHDENAWIFGDTGACGHAGLFGTAEAVAALGRAVLDAAAGRWPAFLGTDELGRLSSPRPGGTLRAGFDGKSAEGSSAGSKFGPASFGHLGFTGTSLWMDPDAELVGVLLSNRVHPTRESDAIRRARPEAYDAIFDWSSAGVVSDSRRW